MRNAQLLLQRLVDVVPVVMGRLGRARRHGFRGSGATASVTAIATRVVLRCRRFVQLQWKRGLVGVLLYLLIEGGGDRGWK